MKKFTLLLLLLLLSIFSASCSLFDSAGSSYITLAERDGIYVGTDTDNQITISESSQTILIRTSSYNIVIENVDMDTKDNPLSYEVVVDSKTYTITLEFFEYASYDLKCTIDVSGSSGTYFYADKR